MQSRRCLATIEAAAAMLEAAHGEHDVDDQSPALTLRGVTKSFGSTRAVEGIDLTACFFLDGCLDAGAALIRSPAAAPG